MLFLALMPLLSFAEEVDMADTLRSNGKIYVVVGVIAIIFVGLIVYLIMLDKRLTKLEKEEK
jgi:CcmD family protein